MNKHQAYIRELRKRGTYDEFVANHGEVCAICGTSPKTRRLNLDHDHKTMRVRGLLCHRCNRALPAWITTDWLRRATAYLERTRAA